MPFQSETQRRYLWANEPEIARDWADTYGSRIESNTGGISRLGFANSNKEYLDFKKWFDAQQQQGQEESIHDLYQQYQRDKRDKKVYDQKHMAATGGIMRLGYADGPPGGGDPEMKYNPGKQGPHIGMGTNIKTSSGDVFAPNDPSLAEKQDFATQKYSGDGWFSGYRNLDKQGQPLMGLAYLGDRVKNFIPQLLKSGPVSSLANMFRPKQPPPREEVQGGYELDENGQYIWVSAEDRKLRDSLIK